jgi:tripartite-type tricarboxylate transporter receptor subunit TctC
VPSTRFLRFTVLATVLVALFGATEASSQSPADFYKGKRLNLIIASGVGGGYDSYARVLSRHWGKYIPGNPTVVVQNMDGAAGITATNHIANKAERDGTVVLATYNTLTIQPLLDNKGILYDSQTLNWIGSIGKQVNICVTWAATSPIKTLDQAKTTEIPVSSTGATGNSATLPNMMNKLIGTKFKVIIGYSTEGQRLALENGEVGGICGLSYTTLMASNPEWILQKKLNILVQSGLEKNKDLTDVPLLTEFIKDENDKKIINLLAAPQEMGRPIVAPPGVPADRVQALRRSFDQVMKDPDFLAESTKAFQFVEPMTGEQMTTMLKEIYQTPKALLDRATELTSNVPVEERKK